MSQYDTYIRAWREPPSTVGPTVPEAYAYCEQVTRDHYENFPVASRLLPKALRPHVCAVYAFARAADDFADEAAYEGERLDRLSEWERMLNTCVENAATHPVFIALGDTLRRCDLPVYLLRDLLNAFRQDVTVTRYHTLDDLLNYCRCSANPIGRIVLHLFDLRDPALGRLSDCICTALQLTNFWQDVAVDLRKGRIYLPQADLERFGVAEDDLRAGRVTPAFAQLLRFQISRTRSLFYQGLPLVSAPITDSVIQQSEIRNPKSVYRHLSHELRLTWLGGMRILDRIEANGHDVFSRRPTLTVRDKIALLYRTWRFRDANREKILTTEGTESTG